MRQECTYLTRKLSKPRYRDSIGISPCDLKFPPRFLSFCFQIGNPLTQSLFIYFLLPFLKCKHESYLDIRENNTK